MIYLGTLGRMIGIKCPASQQLEHEDRYSFRPTLEGKRKAQFRSLSRRTWNLQTSDATTSSDIGTLQQFVQGAWGPGPFVFVSADAPMTNLLTPDGANSQNLATSGVTQGGPVICADGSWAARSLLANGAPNVFFQAQRIPVLPGGVVTASADVMGVGSRVAVSFFTSSGAFISLVASPSGGVSGAMRRLSVTAAVPSTAVSVNVSVQNVVQAAKPQLTWTSKPVPWSDGQGCVQAVVHGGSRDLVLATELGTYSRISFTVSEVG